jgi:phage recombination protein Bet
MSEAVKKEGELEIWQKADVPREIWSAMKSSLYPGAKDESVLMVWDYCKAKKLDPLQKPVHIVPMWIVDKKTDKGEMRDVIMPGIITNRIQASRSGMHAGTSEPEFGPDVTRKLGVMEFTFPEWCRVVVKKLMGGQIVEYPSKEYWIENYATAGKDKPEPNAMWKKRPHAQLAKCAEAQALRKAFPDHVDQNYTAEEMEGKSFDDIKDVTPAGSKASALANLIPPPPVAANDTTAEVVSLVVEVPAHIKKKAEELEMLCTAYEVDKAKIDSWLLKAKARTFSEFDEDQLDKLIEYVKEKNKDE